MIEKLRREVDVLEKSSFYDYMCIVGGKRGKNLDLIKTLISNS